MNSNGATVPSDESSAASGDGTTRSASITASAAAWWTTARTWVTSDRVRIFATGAVTSFVVMGVCLLIPFWLFQFALAGMLAVTGTVLGMLAGATWWAGQSGATDPEDLWDSAPTDTAGVDELFSGFEDFTQDGSQSRSQQS